MNRLMLTRLCPNRLEWLLLFLPMTVVLAAASDQGFRISARPVAQAIRSGGSSVEESEIQFLTNVRASVRNPSITVVSIHEGLSGSQKVKLRCRTNSECLPFYVLVQSAQAGRVESAKPAEPAATAKETALPQLVRKGDPAMLVLENADLRIRVPVVCMEGGARGQKIRLTSQDHRQFYRGEVIAAGLLKSDF